MTLSEHPWMEHDATGHRAQLPDEPYWRANGWSPCDGPPPEADLTRAPTVEDPETPSETGSFAVQPEPAKTWAKTEEEA